MPDRYSTLLNLAYFDPVRTLYPMHNLFLGTSKQRTLDGKRDDDVTATPPLPPPGPVPTTDEDRESRAVVWWIISILSLIRTLHTFNLGSCFLIVATISIWITIISFPSFS